MGLTCLPVLHYMPTCGAAFQVLQQFVCTSGIGVLWRWLSQTLAARLRFSRPLGLSGCATRVGVTTSGTGDVRGSSGVL